MIRERGADEEAAEKHFHVPATSLEALSANRRRCQDMEVLLCGFHVDDVCEGVIGCGRGRSLGCGVCVHVPRLPVVVVLPEHERTIKRNGSQTLRVTPESNMSPRATPSRRARH